MSRQPSYPSDAAVGDKDPESGSPDGSRRSKHLVTGAAIGIGSAAIVAALLYAKKRKSER